MNTPSVFRTCPTTGLKVHDAAENLIKANAVVAVVFLLIGGLFGLSIALRRRRHRRFRPTLLRPAAATAATIPA